MTHRIRTAFLGMSLALVGIATITSCSTNEQLHTNCLVQERLVVEKGDKRVITSCGIFSVNDGSGAGNRSMDTYAALQLGRRYDIRTNGTRSGAFSRFPNVISYRPR